MTGIDIVIALVRCLNLAGLAMLAGALFFRIFLMKAEKAKANRRQD